MDIFEDSTSVDTTNYLEIERFKAKIKDIWSRILHESYHEMHGEGHDDDDDCPSMEEFMTMNAIKFADEPEQETELDSLMNMLDGFMDSDEELESVQSEGKAPKYGSSSLKTNNEQGKKEATIYEYKHASTKTPSESSSRIQGGSYAGTPSGSINKKKHDSVVIKYSPLIKKMQEEIRSLTDRQAIGKRRQLFRA